MFYVCRAVDSVSFAALHARTLHKYIALDHVTRKYRYIALDHVTYMGKYVLYNSK